jgi:CheY-like chemotaxis protein
MPLGTLLIADDDEETLFFLKRSLGRAGVFSEVQVVHDGTEALIYLDKNKKVPRLLLLDVQMPEKDGFQVLKEVRATPRLRRMPVVVFSSSCAEGDVNRAYELGANSYLVKPGNPVRMDEFVSKIHDYWMTLNEVPTSFSLNA